MSAPKYSVTNLCAAVAAAAITDGAGAAKTSATGYLSTYLCDGKMESCWRAAATANTHTIVFDFGGAKSINVAAIFDLESAAGVSVTSVQAHYSNAANTGAWTALDDATGGTGLLTLASRGLAKDGSLIVSTVSARYVKILITFGATAVADVGEIHFGAVTTLTVDVASVDKDPRHNTVVNESMGGSRYRTKFGEARMSLTLPFAPLSSANDASVQTMIDAASGALSSIVLIPNPASPGDVYMGTLDDSGATSTGPDGYRMGRVVTFAEDGRAL